MESQPETTGKGGGQDARRPPAVSTFDRRSPGVLPGSLKAVVRSCFDAARRSTALSARILRADPSVRAIPLATGILPARPPMFNDVVTV